MGEAVMSSRSDGNCGMKKNGKDENQDFEGFLCLCVKERGLGKELRTVLYLMIPVLYLMILVEV